MLVPCMVVVHEFTCMCTAPLQLQKIVTEKPPGNHIGGSRSTNEHQCKVKNIEKIRYKFLLNSGKFLKHINVDNTEYVVTIKPRFFFNKVIIKNCLHNFCRHLVKNTSAFNVTITFNSTQFFKICNERYILC